MVMVVRVPWLSRRAIIAAGVLVLALFIGGALLLVRLHGANTDRSSSGATPEAAARAAVETARLISTPHERFSVVAVEQDGDWALISGTVTRGDLGVSPDGIAIVAHRADDRWTAAMPGSELGRGWLCQAPLSVVPVALRERYLGPSACA
jgi:hypothetical protein